MDSGGAMAMSNTSRRITKAEFSRIADEIVAVCERTGVTCYVDSNRQRVAVVGGRYLCNCPGEGGVEPCCPIHGDNVSLAL